jgi:hypothetical protein
MFHKPTQPAMASQIRAALDVTEGDERDAEGVEWWTCRAAADLINGA